MRGQCTICAEDFEDNPTDGVAIAALPCGHTFHNHCVSQWLASSSTCPHCRKRVINKNVIHKLFFETSDLDSPSRQDTGKLRNKLDEMGLDVRQKSKQVGKLSDELKSLKKRCKEVEKNSRYVEERFQDEQNTTSALKKQVQYFQRQQTEVDTARAEYIQVKRKLDELKSVQRVITGNQDDVKELMSSIGSGDSALRQLATFNVTLKGELDRVKRDKRQYRDERDKLKADLSGRNRELQDKTKELSIVREHLTHSDDDLKHAERERDSLRKKLEKLQRAIDSPTSTSSSLVSRMIYESPAPFIRPEQTGEESNILNITPDMFASPEPVKPSPNAATKQACHENKLKYVRVTSACDQPAAKKPRRDLQDIGNLNILKSGKAHGGLFKRGYNGLGGHDKLDQKNINKPVNKNVFKRPGKPMSSTMKGNPTLPSMDCFVNLT